MKSSKNIVVTLMYNKWELTNRLLVGLEGEKDLYGAIVIDNGSNPDDSADIMFALADIKGYKHSYLKIRQNIGFTRGANYGLREAARLFSDDDVVFLISNDVKINGGFVEQTRDILSGKKALIGNRFIGWDTGWNHFGDKTFGYLEGYFLATTVGGWKDLGFFDENYSPFDMEDVDLSTTALSKGYRLVSLNNPNIVHQNGGTIGFNPEREAITLRNKEYFRQKWVK